MFCREAVARMSKKSDVDIDAKHKKDDDAVATNDVEVKGKKTLTFVEHYLTYSLSWPSLVILTRRLLAIALTAYIGYLSYPVINNIMSPTQVSLLLMLCI